MRTGSRYRTSLKMDPGHLRETWQQDEPRVCIREKAEGNRQALGKHSTRDYPDAHVPVYSALPNPRRTPSQ